MVAPCEVEEAADRGLEAWDDACNSLNITHFLVLGTCLGIYRDGGYIKGDHDIDVGVLCSDSDVSKLTEKLVEKGFVKLPGGILFDVLYKFHPSEDKFLKSFDAVAYKGRTYEIPQPVDEYLKLHYGYYGDWREPRRGAPSKVATTGCYSHVVKLYWGGEAR